MFFAFFKILFRAWQFLQDLKVFFRYKPVTDFQKTLEENGGFMPKCSIGRLAIR